MHERELLGGSLLRKWSLQFQWSVLRQRANGMRGTVCEHEHQRYLLWQLHEFVHWRQDLFERHVRLFLRNN